MDFYENCVYGKQKRESFVKNRKEKKNEKRKGERKKESNCSFIHYCLVTYTVYFQEKVIKLSHEMKE